MLSGCDALLLAAPPPTDSATYRTAQVPHAATIPGAGASAGGCCRPARSRRPLRTPLAKARRRSRRPPHLRRLAGCTRRPRARSGRRRGRPAGRRRAALLRAGAARSCPS